MDFKNFMRVALDLPEKEDTIEYFNLKGRVSGNVLTNAQRKMPTPGYSYEADVTKLWEEFKKLKANCGYELSFNTVMLRILAEGLKVAPRLNAHISYNHVSSCGKLILKKHIDVAMPVFLESGETFPVKVRHIEDKSLKEISNQVADLMKRLETTDLDRVLFDMISQCTIGFMLKGKWISTISQTVTGYVGKYKVASLKGLFKHAPRDGSSLLIEELNEGSVCLTNLGPLNRELNGMVTYGPLLYPQVFLMAIGNAQEKNFAFKNEDGVVDIETKKMMPITLMFDHRIGGFGDVLPFVERINEIFANPEVIHEW